MHKYNTSLNRHGYIFCCPTPELQICGRKTLLIPSYYISKAKNNFYLTQELITSNRKNNAVFIVMNIERDGKRLIQFGDHLRKKRETLKLTQDQVAANSDITKWNLSSIENGKKDFTFTTFLEIAKGLGIPPKDLLDY